MPSRATADPEGEDGCQHAARDTGFPVSLADFRVRSRLGLRVLARRNTEGDGKAIPTVDGDDGHRQVDQLTLVEAGAGLLVHGIGDVAVRDTGYRFGP